MLRDANSMPSSIGPTQLAPPGLPIDRQWYLYHKIRDFITSPASQDITCPKPAIPMETDDSPQSASAAAAEPSISLSFISVPPQKKCKKPTSEPKKKQTKTSKQQLQHGKSAVSVSQNTSLVSPLTASSGSRRSSSRSRSCNVRLADFSL